ncbi:MAG: tetratricopeptide repeat protein [Rhodospirillaceae bacterium]
MTEDADNTVLDLLLDRARQAWMRGDLAKTDVLVDQLLSLAPEGAFQAAAALALRGGVAERRGDPALAIRCFRQALAWKGDEPDWYAGLGLALRALGQQDAAQAAWTTALAIDPNHGDALFHMALMAAETGREDVAERWYHETIQAQSNRVAPRFNLGNLLARQGRLDDAAAWLGTAVPRAKGAERAKIMTNLGVVQRRQGHLELAEMSQRAALVLDPDNAEAQFNLAAVLLAKGDYGEGFQAWRARLTQPGWLRSKPRPDLPEWQGDPLPPGSKVLVLAEQGAGDMIQMLRFLPILSDQGVLPVIEVPPGMERLLAAQFEDPNGWSGSMVPYGALADQSDGTREVQAWVEAFDLPAVFTITTPQDVSERFAPQRYLRTPAGVQSTVSELLGAEPTARTYRIGLCWSGNPTFAENHIRAMPANALEPLLRALPADQVHWGSLQMGAPAAQLAVLTDQAAIEIADWAPGLSDWAVTAAVLERCDLIVTTDTGLAHLAGALGRPTALLLAAHCDWRWGQTGETTCWYPSLRLFRQRHLAQWTDPVSALVDALPDLLA